MPVVIAPVIGGIIIASRGIVSGVGLYYLLRSLAITPASAIGGLLWKLAPEIPFVIAGAFGVVGTFVFLLTVRDRSTA
ncbi:MAG TPA: hypothetical protein VJ875_06745 [Pyrinomonadaceae bacterium]|nr:hypothetical protein [Pyrinomonadaceae bacterium]